MKNLVKTIKSNIKTILFLFFLLSGILVRVFKFCDIPSGFNQDEAFAGYEAFSLLNYGLDSWGYKNPCYFISWGSGMNVLESYLAIPFMKIFGYSVFSLRLPQLIYSCLSLLVFYLLLKEMFSYRVAIIGLGILAITPWHIMLSKWGLESNLAPAFLLFGFFFLIKGIKNNKFWILSAVIYGVTLYAYAMTWIFIPFSLFVFFIYLIFTRQKFQIKYVIISVIVLFFIALPLMLFIMVNKDIIPEIRTSFISIPKMPYMRSSEISFKNLFTIDSYYRFSDILIFQNDSLIWNCIPKYGTYYKVSLLFMVIGIFKTLIDTFKSLRKRSFSYSTVIFINFVCSSIICLMTSYLNINKANSIHFFSLMLITYGIVQCFNIKFTRFIIPCVYAILFTCFSISYFGDYNQQIAKQFRTGVQECVEFINDKSIENVCVDFDIYYPQIMFFDQISNNEYRNTLKYTESSTVSHFGKYDFGIDYENIGNYSAYIFPKENIEKFNKSNFSTIEFGEYAVAYIN